MARPTPLSPWTQSRHRRGQRDSLAKNDSVRNGRTSNVLIIAKSRSTNAGPRHGPTAVNARKKIDIGVDGTPFIEFESVTFTTANPFWAEKIRRLFVMAITPHP